MGKDENILHSQYRPIYYHREYKNLPDLLLKRAEEHANNGKSQWMTDTLTGESYDFASFETLTRRVGSAFYKRGLRKGDIVIFMEIDVVKQPVFLTGLWRANGIGRASYPEEDEETLFGRVLESRTGWIYCEPFHAAMCLRVAERIYWDVEVIVTAPPGIDDFPEGCTSIYEFMEDDGLELPESDTTFNDAALILCTSGTTGNSKGAVISQSNIAWMFIAVEIGLPYMPSDDKVNLVFTKSTHVSGVILPFGSLLAGVRTHYLTFISRERILQVVGKYQPSFIFGFPTYLLLLVHDPEAAKLDLGKLEVIAGAGAPVTAAIEEALMTLPGMKYVANIYGLTECAPLITSLDYDSGGSIDGRPKGSLGKLVPGTSAKFLHSETGLPVGPGEIGEVCFKCGGIFRGYYKNPKASKGAFTEEPFYFKSGDVGYYDDDGFIYLVDRAKDIFKYFNNHVSPTELENVILGHPAIAEVCVIAVPDPDGGGHIPRAFCVRSHQDDEEQVSSADILEYTNSKLAGYKHLRGGLYFVEELPKGKTGKVTRQLVEKINIEALEATENE